MMELDTPAKRPTARERTLCRIAYALDRLLLAGVWALGKAGWRSGVHLHRRQEPAEGWPKDWPFFDAWEDEDGGLPGWRSGTVMIGRTELLWDWGGRVGSAPPRHPQGA